MIVSGVRTISKKVTKEQKSNSQAGHRDTRVSALLSLGGLNHCDTLACTGLREKTFSDMYSLSYLYQDPLSYLFGVSDTFVSRANLRLSSGFRDRLDLDYVL